MYINIPLEPMELTNAHEWFENYCRSIEKEASDRKNIVEDNDYMEWLYNCLVNSLSNQDEDNFSKLKPLYNMIDEYAYKRYSISYSEEGCRFYYLRYKDIVFKIGYNMEKDDEFFCLLEQGDIGNVRVFNFEDIKDEEQKKEFNGFAKEELRDLYQYLMILKEKGITDEEIVETTAKALRLENKNT